MTQSGFPHRAPRNLTAGRYLDKLSKALPGARNWAGMRSAREFWPDGAKFVISISLQFEAGTQQAAGASSPVSPIHSQHSALSPKGRDEYGVKEGIPRLLDVFQRRRVCVTSHMAGEAVETNPGLAREIVERGHEAAAYGPDLTPQQELTPEEERASHEANIRSVMRATGIRPIGFHAMGLRGTPHTLEILQDLGFLYHIDDVSRDEPFLATVRGKPLVVVPYTLELNDLVLYEERSFNSEQYATELRNAFEMLYTESENKRRMMSISAHDRIAGQPARSKVLEEFIIYAQRRPGVVFLRKDEIARFALSSSLTPREEERLRSADAA